MEGAFCKQPLMRLSPGSFHTLAEGVLGNLVARGGHITCSGVFASALLIMKGSKLTEAVS